MQENCPSGLAGGGAELNRLSLPRSALRASQAEPGSEVLREFVIPVATINLWRLPRWLLHFWTLPLRLT